MKVIIGSFMSEIKREEVILSSKCYFPVGDMPNMMGVSRKRIIIP